MSLHDPEGLLPLVAPSRRALTASLFFGGYALSAISASAEPIVTPADGLVIEEIAFPGADRYALPAYVARPEGEGRRPAILVASEIFGVHAYIQDVCRRFAALGYVAIAPDYFDRAGDPATLTAMAEIMPLVAQAKEAQVAADTDAAIGWLKAQKYVNDRRIGMTGFCWGGAVTWMAAARNRDLRAAVAWYGRLVAPPADNPLAEPGRKWPLDVVDALKCPVLGLYAGKDQGIPLDTVQQMRAKLSMLKKSSPAKGSEIVVYDGAAHGFHADYRASYDAVAAAGGWKRLLSWFAHYGVAPDDL